jgi:hypothetical protein
MVTIQKSKDGKDSKVRVTFTMPAPHDCDCLYLVGSFYPWNESIYRMQRADDGMWEVTLELAEDRSAPDARHQFGSEISLAAQ